MFTQHLNSTVRFLLMALVPRRGNQATKNSVDFYLFAICIGPNQKAYYINLKARVGRLEEKGICGI